MNKLFDLEYFSIFEDNGKYSYTNNKDGRHENFDFIEKKGVIKEVYLQEKRVFIDLENGKTYSLSPGFYNHIDWIFRQRYD